MSKSVKNKGKRYVKHRSRRRIKRRNRTINRKIITLPGSDGINLFSIPKKDNVQKILVNQHKQYGNMIMGLRKS